MPVLHRSTNHFQPEMYSVECPYSYQNNRLFHQSLPFPLPSFHTPDQNSRFPDLSSAIPLPYGHLHHNGPICLFHPRSPPTVRLPIPDIHLCLLLLLPAVHCPTNTTRPNPGHRFLFPDSPHYLDHIPVTHRFHTNNLFHQLSSIRYKLYLATHPVPEN